MLPLFKQDGPYFHFAPGLTDYVLKTYSMPGTVLDVSCIDDLISFSCKVKVKSLSRVQLFETPWTVAYQAPPSVHGIFQARVLEWVAILCKPFSLRSLNIWQMTVKKHPEVPLGDLIR